MASLLTFIALVWAFCCGARASAEADDPTKSRSMDVNIRGSIQVTIDSGDAGIVLLEDLKSLTTDQGLQARILDRYGNIAGFTIDVEQGIIAEYRKIRGRVIIIPLKTVQLNQPQMYFARLRDDSGDRQDFLVELERGSTTASLYLGDFPTFAATSDARKSRALELTVDRQYRAKTIQTVNPSPPKGFSCVVQKTKQYLEPGKMGAFAVDLGSCLWAPGWGPCLKSLATAFGYLYSAWNCF